MRRLALILAVPFLVATGCGDSSSGGGGGGGGSPTGPTCTFPADSCFVASGATFSPTDLTTFQGTCTGSGGTFAASGTCSTASTVTGYCAIPNGPANALAGTAIAGMIMNGYYYTPAYDATTASGDCTGIGGTWTGGTVPVCGNGTINAPEVCDGANLNGQTCVTQGYTSGTLACAANCQSFVVTGCIGSGPVCGDNNAQGAELCDGSDLNGQTCLTQGFAGGTLACSGTCLSFNTTGCTAQVCGDNNATGTEVCDGSDLNGQTCAGLGYTGGTLACNGGCTGYVTTGCTGGGGTTIRCLLAGNMCSQLTGAMTASDLTTLSGQCTGSGGTYAVAACSTASTVPGYCSYTWSAPVSGATLAQADYYYTATWNATTAAADCFGTWVGGAAPVCGDGSVTGTEVCDGANLNGQSCSTQGFTGGTLTCNAGCLTFNTSACTGGGGTAETEPNGSIGTADGPYTADVTLTGSITASDYDYFAIQNTSGVAVSVTLSTVLAPTCATTSYDTVLTVYNSGGTSIASNDDTIGLCSQVTVSIPAGTTYYAAVRGFGGSTMPSYQLVVNFP